MIIQSDISFDFSITLFEFNLLTNPNTMAIIIFDLNFIDDLVWLNETVQYNTLITSYHLIKNILVNGAISF